MGWISLTGIEVGWVLGAWLLMAGKGPAEGDAGTAGRGVAECWRTLFAWGYVLYHLPLLLVDYLTAGWGTRLLEGRGLWALAEATLIGVVTVAVYGTAVTWFLW